MQSASVPPHDPLDLPALPGHLIRRVHQIAVALFHEECEQAGLTPIQYAVLATLRRQDGVDQITLAGLTALNRSTTGDVVTRLESAGLLARSASEADKRVKVLHITDAGRAAIDRATAAVLRVQDRLLAPLDTDERKVFVSLLGRIAQENNELSRAPMRLPGE